MSVDPETPPDSEIRGNNVLISFRKAGHVVSTPFRVFSDIDLFYYYCFCSVDKNCDIRPECTKMQFRNRIFIDQKKEHLTGKIDDFDELATLFGQLDKSARVSFN